MGIFGWSYPPGAANDPNAPYNQTDIPLTLDEDKTLKGYGRRGHGLNGKDADLDECGQNVVESAYWFDDDTIRIEGRRYASVCGSEEWTEAQWDVATEIVCSCDLTGEWDGDYWVFAEPYSLTVQCPWSEDESDDANIKRATQTAFEAIEKDSLAFEDAIRNLHQQLTGV